MIPVTKIHTDYEQIRLLEQRQRILRNVQADMARNAEIHKRMLAQGVPLEKVQEFIRDCAANYTHWLGVVESAKDDPVNGADVAEAMQKAGYVEADFTDVSAPLKATASALSAADLSDKKIVESLDAVISAVGAPQSESIKSLWPE